MTATLATKQCIKCELTLPLDAFTKHKAWASGIDSRCRKCLAVRRKELRTPELLAKEQAYRAARPDHYAKLTRAGHARRRDERYGLREGQYDAMFALQEGKCAICDKPESGRRLAVDHHHGTGAVRGLLCLNCNVALGMLADDATVLRAAARYLESRTG